MNKEFIVYVIHESAEVNINKASRFYYGEGGIWDLIRELATNTFETDSHAQAMQEAEFLLKEYPNYKFDDFSEID